MLIAIPSNKPGGLDAAISEHFGHCEMFTLVEVEGEELGEVKTLDNGAHEQGECLAPVTLLKEAGVEVLLAAAMGKRPLQGMEEIGIKVHASGEAATVREGLDGYVAGSCPEFSQEQSCGHGHGHGGHGDHGGDCGHHGGGGHGDDCGHHHHHEHVERKIVRGPAEQDRVVFISLKISDEAGELIEETDGIGFLFGCGAMVPGLEKALEGHVAGDIVKVRVSPEEGYGERDEERMIKAPAKEMPPDLEVGGVVQAQMHNGGITRLILVSVEDGEATLDANHPLAGKTINFEAELLEVQEATPEDLAEARR